MPRRRCDSCGRSSGLLILSRQTAALSFWLLIGFAASFVVRYPSLPRHAAERRHWIRHTQHTQHTQHRRLSSTFMTTSNSNNVTTEECSVAYPLAANVPTVSTRSLEALSPLERLRAVIADLQVEFGNDAVALVRDEMKEDSGPIRATMDARPTINSLVFLVHYGNEQRSSSSSDYVLVILRDIHRVNVTALEDAVQNSEWLRWPPSLEDAAPSEPPPPPPKLRVTLTLAPSVSVARTCGFGPGTVPPIGTWPAPRITLLDQSLVDEAVTTHLRGGGGQDETSCVVALDVVLQQPRVVVAPVAMISPAPTVVDWYTDNALEGMDDALESASIETTRNGGTLLHHPKPFFAVAPPSNDVASRALMASRGTRVTPVRVSFVGRIASVRRMARGLAFCDVIPPDHVMGPVLVQRSSSSSHRGRTDNEAMDPWPWRNPVDTKAMAVQLIAGKTLWQTTGSDDAIRRLQPGQLLLLHGRTNVGNRDSLQNWLTKRSLDIVLQSYQVLTEGTTLPVNRPVWNGRPATSDPQRRGSTPPTPVDPETCLRLHDLYDTSCDDADPTGHVVLVDDLVSVRRFATDLSRLLVSLKSPKSNTGPDLDGNGLQTVALVGIDCEWQPSFMLASPRDPQPVLLLQVCLHSLNRTYLFDLQTMLRPMMPPAQSMDKLEREVSSALGALFESKRLIKVGFQVVHDLRQCAASYPHMPTLHNYNSVLETSTLGKKAIRIAGSGDARIATSSLTRLVEQFIGKPLNKQEQCSDWGNRPLSAEQIEYAALDAAVTPIMVLRMVEDLDAQFFWEKPQLGRWENDLSFKKVLTSWRFVFVHTTDYEVQRKLKAKRVVGDPLIVSQSWTTGDVPPRLPALPENGAEGPYTDICGLVQVPSAIVAIRSTRIDDIIDSMIGERVGKSKDKCVEAFLRRPDVMPAGARLDYPQRSGFVEFRDGVALFVNMPSTPGGRFQPRSYPNEWLNEGRVLTWFLRETDWKQGSSELAKKLVSSPNKVVVTLFVRMGSTGAFLCCGRCRVQDPLSAVTAVNGNDRDYYGEASAPPDNWTLIQLHLVLLDWNKLRLNSDFQALMNPDLCYASDPYGVRLD